MQAIEFTTLEQELQVYKAMTNEEAVQFYNVDYKEEALQYILDWWQLENENN